MKHLMILRILSTAVVLSLLALAIPVVPALAVNDLSLTPTSGKSGDTIYVTGQNYTGFVPAGDFEYYALVYFAKDNVSVNISFATNVHTYSAVESYIPIDGTGVFESTFVVPTVLTDGTIDENVINGTYYVYVTIVKYNTVTLVETPLGVIRGKAAFTVTAGGTLNALSPTTGPAGTDVTITGTNFMVSYPIIFKLDTTTLTPKSGDVNTSTTGSFTSIITIPAGTTAGTHSISVTVSSITKSATFTVTASAALGPLNPVTGPAGTDVTVTGTNFMVSYPIIFKFDTTTLTPKSGDTNTSTSGGFTSIITIPPGVTAGAHNINVTVGTTTVTTQFTVIASAALGSLNPATGPAGTDVTVTGTNFMVSYPIIFKLDTTTLSPKSGDINTSTAGSFTSVITIPSGATAGAHTISVTVGTVTLTATFTVTGAPTPTPTPTPTPPPSNAVLNVITSGDTIGSQIGIGGAGFIPGADVTFKYDNILVATVKADSSGLVSKSFEVPPSKYGEHTIIVSDGTNSATTKYTVESNAPPVPPPLLPESGEKVDSPIKFDWQDVADDSAPVTYELQIATDDTFAANSIVLEKKALNTSELILSELDELELAGQADAFYWRVKSVDGALNESAWTIPGDFFFSAKSPFPKWAIILIGVGGGLFLLLIGIWIGRRTAFYY